MLRPIDGSLLRVPFEHDYVYTLYAHETRTTAGIIIGVERISGSPPTGLPYRFRLSSLGSSFPNQLTATSFWNALANFGTRVATG